MNNLQKRNNSLWLIVVGLVFAITVVIVIYYILVSTKFATKRFSLKTSPSPVTISTSTTQYKNTTFNYGFEYNLGDTFSECTMIRTCQIFDRNSVHVEVIGTSTFSIGNTKEDLLERDLYCNADGPGISITCKNTLVTEITSSTGEKGYKINRIKSMTGEADRDDVAYIYLLPEEVQGEGRMIYSAILFYVEKPTAENIQELDEIAASYVTF